MFLVVSRLDVHFGFARLFFYGFLYDGTVVLNDLEHQLDLIWNFLSNVNKKSLFCKALTTKNDNSVCINILTLW